MLNNLVKSIMMYGSKVWGWREYDGLERVQEKYLKWELALNRQTLGSIRKEKT